VPAGWANSVRLESALVGRSCTEFGAYSSSKRLGTRGFKSICKSRVCSGGSAIARACTCSSRRFEQGPSNVDRTRFSRTRSSGARRKGDADRPYPNQRAPGNAGAPQLEAVVAQPRAGRALREPRDFRPDRQPNAHRGLDRLGPRPTWTLLGELAGSVRRNRACPDRPPRHEIQPDRRTSRADSVPDHELPLAPGAAFRRAPVSEPPLTQVGRAARTPLGCCRLVWQRRMEPLWSPVVATGGNWSQIRHAQQPEKQAKTVAIGCDRLPSGAHGKECHEEGLPAE
jgi:hypothetical protein